MSTTDRLTRLDVAIVGAERRDAILRVFEDEGFLPAGDSKSGVWLVCGKEALVRLLGAAKVYEIQAPSKYEGQQKTYRSGWEPYCFPHDGRWLVSCIHPAKLRKMRWLNLPNVRAAVRHAIHLALGGVPAKPEGPIERPELWEDH